MSQHGVGERTARLEARLASWLKQAEQVDGKLDKIAADVADIKNSQMACAATQTERWKGHMREHADDSRRKYASDGITGAVAVVVAWLLSQFGFKP